MHVLTSCRSTKQNLLNYKHKPSLFSNNTTTVVALIQTTTLHTSCDSAAHRRAPAPVSRCVRAVNQGRPMYNIDARSLQRKREIMNVALDVAKQVGEDTKMVDLSGTVVKRIGYDCMIDPSVVDIYLDPEVLHLWPPPATLRAWDLKYSRMCAKGVTVRWPVDFAIKEYL